MHDVDSATVIGGGRTGTGTYLQLGDSSGNTATNVTVHGALQASDINSVNTSSAYLYGPGGGTAL